VLVASCRETSAIVIGSALGRAFLHPSLATCLLSLVVFIPSFVLNVASSVCVCVCTDPVCVSGQRPQGEDWGHAVGALKMLIKSQPIMTAEINCSPFPILKGRGIRALLLSLVS